MQEAMELKEMIKQERKMLDKVVAECGVDHEDAYDQSKKLDDLITRYYEDYSTKTYFFVGKRPTFWKKCRFP